MKRCNRWKGLLLPGAAVFLAAVLNWFVVLNAYVPSGSMEPAIPSGSMVLGYRLAYHLRGSIQQNAPVHKICFALVYFVGFHRESCAAELR